MNSQIEKKGSSWRRITRRGVLSAAFGLGLFALHPSSAFGQEPKSDVIAVYPQCGGKDIPENQTVMVVVSGQEDNKHFSEYPLGKKPGQCDNPPYQTSSMVLESVSRSSLSRPDVITGVTRPISCPTGTVSFALKRLVVVDGLDLVPDSGVIGKGNQPDIHVNVHTDLLSDGNYFTSGQAWCKTPKGINLPGDVFNFAIQVKQ